MEWKPDEIKTLRQALGLTQAEFSSKLSVSQGLVAQWETGKKSPTEDFNKIFLQLKKEIPTYQKPSFRGESGCTTAFISAPLEIKALREKLGLTRAELAKKLKISKCLVKYWEKGIGTFFPCQFHANIL